MSTHWILLVTPQLSATDLPDVWFMGCAAAFRKMLLSARNGRLVMTFNPSGLTPIFLLELILILEASCSRAHEQNLRSVQVV